MIWKRGVAAYFGYTETPIYGSFGKQLIWMLSCGVS